MNGFLLTFYTEQNRRHGNKTICEWLLHEVKELGIHGATVISGSEGIGHAGARHAAHMLKLTDQPVQIIVAATDEEAERLLDIVRAANVHVFYTRSRVEYGLLGEDDPQHHHKRSSLFHRNPQGT